MPGGSASLRRRCRVCGGEFGALLVRRADDDEDEVREGRVVPLSAELDLLLVEAVEVVVPRELDRRAERREALHEDFALDIAAAGASGDLGEQLEGAFAGAEVGQVQARGRR